VEGLVSSLPVVNVKLGESPATTHGDAFFAWLKEGLANGTVKVNTADAHVHVTTEGVFIEKAGAFKQYVELYNVPVNMFSVFQQFGNLFGLTKLSGADYRIEQLFSDRPDSMHQKSRFVSPLSSKSHSMREGAMVPASLVFTKTTVPPATTHLKSLPKSQKEKNLPDINPHSAPSNKIK